MDQILKCRDTGLICNSIICGETKEEVLKKAGEHAEFMHYMNKFPKTLYEKTRLRFMKDSAKKELREHVRAVHVEYEFSWRLDTYSRQISRIGGKKPLFLSCHVNRKGP